MDMAAYDEILDEDLRGLLRGLLLELAQALELLVRRGATPVVPQPSQDPLDPAYLTRASLLLGMLAAADHLQALAKLIGQQKVTLAIESTSRGVIEALARARWIAGAANETAAGARALSLLRRDASSSGSTSIYQARSMAHELSSTEYIDLLHEALKSVGGKVQVPSLTDLSTSLLIAAFPTMDGRRKYGELSAIAHGSAAAIGPYATPEGTLKLPKLVALNTVGAVIGCVDAGVHAIAATPTRLFRSTAVEEIWIPVISRVSPIVDGLRGQDLPSYGSS